MLGGADARGYADVEMILKEAERAGGAHKLNPWPSVVLDVAGLGCVGDTAARDEQQSAKDEPSAWVLHVADKSRAGEFW